MDDTIDPAIYALYYREFYPFELIHNWLSYGSDSLFSRREFSIMSNDEMYQRYLSYDTAEDFKNDIISKSPSKIDIGAVYSSKPRIHKIVASQSFIPLEREFILDIDLTDYDDVRQCCSKTNICSKCWSFVGLAAKIIDKALEMDFGFKTRIWVYSGRRGIHCWVCDERARKLNSASRNAIVDYLTVVKGGDHREKKVSLIFPLHNSLKRASEYIVEYFENVYIQNQEDVFLKENLANLFNLVLYKDCQQALNAALDQIIKEHDVLQKWAIIKNIILTHSKSPKGAYEIMFQFCYPRIDVNVSKGLNHLLKSPFCVHPKTGSVCIPIKIENIDDFDLRTVPNIYKLLGGYESETSEHIEKFAESVKLFRSYMNIR